MSKNYSHKQPLGTHTKNFVIKLISLPDSKNSPGCASTVETISQKKNYLSQNQYHSLEKTYDTQMQKFIMKIPDELMKMKKIENYSKNDERNEKINKFESLLVIRNCQRMEYRNAKNCIDIDIAKRIYQKIKENNQIKDKNHTFNNEKIQDRDDWTAIQENSMKQKQKQLIQAQSHQKDGEQIFKQEQQILEKSYTNNLKKSLIEEKSKKDVEFGEKVQQKSDAMKKYFIRQLNFKTSSEISYFQKIQELKNKKKYNEDLNLTKAIPLGKMVDQSFSHSQCKFKEENKQGLKHELSEKKQICSTLKGQNRKHHISNISNHKKRKDLLPEIVSKKQKKFPVLNYDAQKLKQIKAESFIVMEYPSERVILSHKSNLQVQIASLTKMMTFYVINQISQRKGVVLSRQSLIVSNAVLQVGGTSAQLIPGQCYTIEDLLYGLMLPSGNDAAIMLAIWGGTQLLTNSQQQSSEENIPYEEIEQSKAIKIFVQQMNRISKILQLQSTKFANPHGLPHQEGRSSAKDVARLSCVCLKNQLFSVVVKTKLYKKVIKNYGVGLDSNHIKVVDNNGKLDKIFDTNVKPGRIVCWQNTNKLLKRDGFIGLKTGITVTAGPCLASAYEFRDTIFITVVLRAKKISHRFSQTRKILHYVIKSMMELSEQEEKLMKRLKKKSESDCSEDEQEFGYDKLTSKEILKRCNIVNDI